MTREELDRWVQHEIAEATRKWADSVTNIADFAYKVGKHNAEADAMIDIVKEALTRSFKEGGGARETD